MRANPRSAIEITLKYFDNYTGFAFVKKNTYQNNRNSWYIADFMLVLRHFVKKIVHSAVIQPFETADIFSCFY